VNALRQNTAATILVGPVLDSAGLPYASAVIGDFNLTKNGTTAALAAAATATHSHNGHYLLALVVGNVDTLPRAVVTMNNSAYAMPPARFDVLAVAVFDAIFGTVALSTYAGGPVSSVAAPVAISQTFPANFATLGITAGGKVSGVVLTDSVTTNLDKVGYSLTVTPPNVTQISAANLALFQATYTASPTVDANVVSFRAGVITSAAFAIGAVTKVATGFLERLMFLAKWTFVKKVKDATTGVITGYDADGTTPIGTQAFVEPTPVAESLGALS
jgi:hypothetical protein